ncbi:NAD-dependent epimerase/dehydratase family protein [Ruegeria lacuscaerulensis]|uniref:NAD-dependent epimerase/dehydratase family protein n=1 Tax=Ruegeria lacuscaerulensis TaxID=55218 RepID=UPI00147C7B92|nr:NAD-dependent epimerase/dehydratase family protein [Ruegeria lacuscaerulensis]
MSKKILVTGNTGYVGPVLGRFLKQRHADLHLVGYDAGFFSHSLTGSDFLPEIVYDTQHYGDTRDITADHLAGCDAVVHLAAVSNDPMGKEFETVTHDINRAASVRLAKLAAECGVSNFVFASSCSMYGAAEGGPRKETDATAPQTAYARSKIGTELDLQEADLGDMTLTSLRFATACGMSDRLRLDLVLNDFVACAMATNKIVVLSDGTPWRPLIDVEDMARAIEWAALRETSNGGKFLAVNAGRDESNVRISELAEKVKAQFPGTVVEINTDAPPDKRSYQVDFALFKSLAPESIPQVTLEQSIERLRAGLEHFGFGDTDFRSSSFIRLNALRAHIDSGRLSRDLRWGSL